MVTHQSNEASPPQKRDVVRIVGDVHGRIGAYKRAIAEAAYSVQLGDMGFKKHYKILNFAEIDPSRHVFIPGNHDDYRQLPAHALGLFGTRELGPASFFWVRGAASPDKRMRIPGESWWPEEELTYREGLRALDLYKAAKPRLVLSHDCPGSVSAQWLGTARPSRTGQLLDALLEHHQPDLWLFGHHHRSIKIALGQTTFRGLGELEAWDLS